MEVVWWNGTSTGVWTMIFNPMNSILLLTKIIDKYKPDNIAKGRVLVTSGMYARIALSTGGILDRVRVTPAIVRGDEIICVRPIKSQQWEAIATVGFRLGSDQIESVFELLQQTLDLLPQRPHTFLAGPSTGLARKRPVFRALILEDLPEIELDDLDDVRIREPQDGDVLVYNASEQRWEPGESDSVGKRQSILTFPGELEVGINPLKIYNRLGREQEITELYACVGKAALGGNISVSVLRNGSMVDTVIIPAGSTSHGLEVNDRAWPEGSYLQARINTIGTSSPGEDLVVHIIHH